MLSYKLLAILAIFVTGVIGGLLSRRLDPKDEAGGGLLSLGNGFSGGIFLGAGLLHMLPDAGENLGRVDPEMDFPLAFLLCGAGFLLILLLERVLFRAHEAFDALQGGGGAPVRSAYVLAVVLSVHSVFAGIALGVEATVFGSLAIFLAIIAHKGSAAFALGVGLERGSLDKGLALKIITIFACMTPVGVLLGMACTALLTGAREAAVEGVFDGLAAGTFLYVATLEVIGEEFETPAGALLKFGLVLAGFCVMAALALWL